MTGVPTLGMIGQQDHCAGGPSIDQILLDRSPLLGGSLSSSPSKTLFGSLQARRRHPSDAGRGRAPRAVLPAPHDQRGPQPGAPADVPRDAAIHHVQPPVRRGVAVRGRHRDGAGARAERPRLRAQGSGAASDPGPRQPAPADRRTRDRHPAARDDARPTHVAAARAVCVPPASPPMFPLTATGKQGTRRRLDHPRRRRLLPGTPIRPAIRTRPWARPTWR